MRPENLVFLISAPRSGSTLLQRMLASHSQVHTHSEPHLLMPLYYLGYYATVEKAPYDHVHAGQALRELAEELPRGEDDYLDALRAYADTIYGRVLAPSGKRYFLDKTPAYALVLPFIAKLYPAARYVVLTRHPLAIAHSLAHSFFDGDYAAAHAANPVLERFVPPIGTFLLERRVAHVRVRYEDLVTQPEAEMQRLLAYLGLAYEPQVIEYGRNQHVTKSFGDPVGVQKHTRPVTDSLDTWAQDLQARPEAMALARRSLSALQDAHLDAWGYPRDTLFDALARTRPARTRRTQLDAFQIKRRAVLALRRNIQHNALGRAVSKVRYLCDVLLRP